MDNTTHKNLFGEFPPVPTEAWEEKILADLKGADYAKKLIWNTGEGFDVRPYYRDADLAGLDHLHALPGEIPFTRGVKKRKNDWIVREDILTPDLTRINPIARNAVARGAGAIGLKANEVTTHKELSDLLSGIDFTRTGIHFISAKTYPLVLEFLIYELNHRGMKGDLLQGSVNFDPLGFLLLHGNFYIGWEYAIEEAEYLLGIVRDKLPGFRVMTVNGHYFQDSGSTLVQELAFSMGCAAEYLAALTDRGASVDDVAPCFQLSLAVGPSYFLELAKFRAARLLWSRLVETFGAKREESYRLFIHATTATWNKSVFDPYVNMLRTTTESMSAALGNADSITVTPFDQPYHTPDEFSRRIARNQQLVLKEESYLDKIVDPGAGSYYIETLTGAIAHHAWEAFRKVEEQGGMLACIKSGYIQDEVEKSRKKKEEDIAARRLILLGTNQFPNPTEAIPDVIESAGPAEKVTEPLFKPMVPFRVAAAFEEIRLATEQHVRNGHKRPAVFLLTMGNLAMLRARAGFATNFFGCAGYEIIDNPGFASVDEGVGAALASGAGIVVLCSSDEEYPEIVPAAARKIKDGKASVKVVVAGFPKDHVESFRSAGVDEFIHVRSNLLETLRKFQSELL